MIYVIGAGGGGSWLTPSLCMLTCPENVTVIDGDTLEEKNLNRQLYTVADIGKNKATALSERYGCKAIPAWYNRGSVRITRRDWLMGCVDNNPARLSILATVDESRCHAIIGANEVTSAEAYAYRPDWKGSRIDPRTYYPELLTVKTGDPQAAAIGCTGAAQESNRQLVSANYMAAALQQHLFVAWALEYPKADVSVLPHMPHKLTANLTTLTTDKVGEL